MKRILTFLLLAAAPAWADFRIEQSGDSLKVLDGDALVTEYRTDWRVPYLYPLMSPSGANITRHWPTKPDVAGEEQDHPHHRSVWLGHGAVNGADFWAFKDDKDANIKHLGFVSQGVEKDGAAKFTVNLSWIAQGKPVLNETRGHSVRLVNEHTLVLEFDITLTPADGDVLFGDTKEGTFAFRLDRTLRLKGKDAKSHIINAQGITDMEAWGKRANWVAYHGPDELGKPAVAALFDHPSNFRYPTYWHVRDYGLVAANPFGVHDFEKNPDANVGNFTLERGKQLHQKYAIIVHEGDLQSADLNKLWEAFSKK